MRLEALHPLLLLLPLMLLLLMHTPSFPDCVSGACCLMLHHRPRKRLLQQQQQQLFACSISNPIHWFRLRHRCRTPVADWPSRASAINFLLPYVALHASLSLCPSGCTTLWFSLAPPLSH